MEIGLKQAAGVSTKGAGEVPRGDPTVVVRGPG